jgi:chromosome segregation ATPase
MSDDMGNDLREAEAKLEGLTVERLDVQGRLHEAIEAGDADSIIRLERRTSEIEVELFAARAKVLKLRRSKLERQRRVVLAERDALEVELASATKVYADLISEADEARQRMQILQVKTFGASSTAEQFRQDGNDLNNELKTLVNSRIGGNR